MDQEIIPSTGGQVDRKGGFQETCVHDDRSRPELQFDQCGRRQFRTQWLVEGRVSRACEALTIYSR